MAMREMPYGEWMNHTKRWKFWLKWTYSLGRVSGFALGFHVIPGYAWGIDLGFWYFSAD
jgi:hypothetical protein